MWNRPFSIYDYKLKQLDDTTVAIFVEDIDTSTARNDRYATYVNFNGYLYYSEVRIKEDDSYKKILKRILKRINHDPTEKRRNRKISKHYNNQTPNYYINPLLKKKRGRLVCSQKKKRNK